MAEQQLDHTLALLARTPPTLDAWLRNLPEIWTHRDEGSGTWSAAGVVGHLVHAERTNWIPRLKTLLQFGVSRPFAAFDRLGHEREIQERSLPALLDEFARLRASSVADVRELDLREADFMRTGTHPAFGSVTLHQLLAAWAVHDLTHIHQISRVLAHQYRQAVGPWSEYLGVLKTRQPRT
jgi:uncharacterized damage-inducible protein DinB